MWRIDLSRRLDLGVFAGPSWILLRQDLVNAVTFSETYPYDEASFTGALLGRKAGNAIGYNAGAEMTYSLTRTFGVGAQVRWSKAIVPLTLDSGEKTDVSAGGTQIAAGVRLAF